MRIGIVGSAGVVGGTYKEVFTRLGHTVIGHDLKLGTKITNVLDTDIVYIAVPTPSKKDGECDTSIVESVVKDLTDYRYDGVICIKSTVKPGTTKRLIDQYFNEKIVFVPEFLRERSAFSDAMEGCNLLAIGTIENEDEPQEGGCIEQVILSHGVVPQDTCVMKPTEAELLKYAWNTFNAMRVVWANEMYEVCKATDSDWDIVKGAFLANGPQISHYLDCNENFRGYSGQCLPKDTLALAHFIKEIGLDMKLFETIDKENKKFKRTVWPKMREE